MSMLHRTAQAGLPRHVAKYGAAAILLVSITGINPAHASAAPQQPATRPQTAATAQISTASANSNRTMTAQQYIQQQHELRQEIKKMQLQVEQITATHQETMAQNQALQLANDNLSVQVKVLQSEQSAQMFLYGAATIGIGGVLGFVLGSVMARRQRRW